MGFTNFAQLRELFLSCGMGFLLGGYYDVFRLLRRWFHPSKPVVFALDTLFFASSAVAVFLFSLAMTNGTVRSYVLLGTAVGFAAYRHTVGRALIRLVGSVIVGLRRLCNGIKQVVGVPCQWVVRWFGKASRALGEVWKNIAKKSKKIFKKGLQPVGDLLYNHRV